MKQFYYKKKNYETWGITINLIYKVTNKEIYQLTKVILTLISVMNKHFL